MIAFAEAQFRLAAADKDGFTLREKLEGLIERSQNAGKPEAHRAAWEDELAGAPLPAALGYIWTVYNRLRRRAAAGFGPGPISWADIDAFTRHSRFALAPWELELIEELDDLYLREHARQARENAPKQADKQDK